MGIERRLCIFVLKRGDAKHGVEEEEKEVEGARDDRDCEDSGEGVAKECKDGLQQAV